MKTVYLSVVRDESSMRFHFRGKDIPAGLVEFGRKASNGVFVDGTAGDLMPVLAACDYLRDCGVENIVNDGWSGRVNGTQVC